jgi:hypothetical protein
MSITAEVTNYIKFSGDVESESVYNSGDQEDSPGMSQLVSLSSGNNTVLLPDVDGFTVHGLAIIPPNPNEVEVTVKGTNADTGITLAAGQASVIQFGTTPPASIVIAASTTAPGFRLVWF